MFDFFLPKCLKYIILMVISNPHITDGQKKTFNCIALSADKDYI